MHAHDVVTPQKMHYNTVYKRKKQKSPKRAR